MADQVITDQELDEAGLRLEIDGEIARVTLARPERRNAMTGRTWSALASIGQNLPESVRIVVLAGDGASFSSGIDLTMFEPGGPEGESSPLASGKVPDPAELDATIAGYQEGFRWLRRPDLVSIAAVHGHAIGAGFQLALSCDLRILADNAQLCMKEPALGLVPDLTGTKPLVDLVGPNRALELCLTARRIPATEARELGLAELVVGGDELEGAVSDLAAAVLTTPAEAARATKELLLQAPDNSLAEQAAAERRAQIGRLTDLARQQSA
ncbi:enoyl-CoA hydratase [Haloactinospora alba]|uniref:Enoyl-CoA hydratase n=1 Tax=Haloactinospora alba TaxID=405555 RepID=A0A543NJ60_9ACTN|nr:enoyl-CoA hydratase/isomerase family protein [Haloactinospora alba]TQN31872.1 enoyl-CoA hydratase [Haloactinospora alba]